MVADISNGMTGAATVRALTQRVLDFKADSTGSDYLFDRSFLDLYDRCKEARSLSIPSLPIQMY